MMTRWLILGTLTALLLCPLTGRGASQVASANFLVTAPNQELAQEFARLAEQYRKQKAIEWLGQEMPRWPTPCPLRVDVTMSGPKGATNFSFDNGVYQDMFISGPLDRLRNSVLPHEITHTVLAHYFRRPVPRWADEGGSVYSEDQIERSRHDDMNRSILNAGRGMPLRRLFNLKNYPDDVMVLYAEGYAVSKFLIESSDRQTFLNFINLGMQKDASRRERWDEAARVYYHYRDVDDMEQAWLDHLRKGRAAALAKNNAPPADTKLVVRQSIPPAQPSLDPLPVSRGVPPTAAQEQSAQSERQGPPLAARLGDPIPLTSPPQATVSASTKPRSLPPPVILFPPEPLPLR